MKQKSASSWVSSLFPWKRQKTVTDFNHRMISSWSEKTNKNFEVRQARVQVSAPHLPEVHSWAKLVTLIQFLLRKVVVVIIPRSYSGYLKPHPYGAWCTHHSACSLAQLLGQANYSQTPVQVSGGRKLPGEVSLLLQEPSIREPAGRKCLGRDQWGKMQVFSPAVSLLHSQPIEDALFPDPWQLPHT